MTRIQHSFLYVFLLAIFCGSFLSGPAAYGQNRVSFTFQNRQIVSGAYQAELWATVATGATWTVGNSLLNISFSGGLAVNSFNNVLLLDPDPDFISGGYMPLRQTAYGTGLSVSMLNLSGFFIEKTGSFRIGTLRWEIRDGFYPDGLAVITTGGDESIIMNSWDMLSYNCGDTTCFSAPVPTPRQIGNPAVITQQPQSVSICTGNDALFSVTATGATLTYQWQKAPYWTGSGSWQDISGATAASLVIPSVSEADTLFYRVLVRGDSPPHDTSHYVNLQALKAPVVVSQTGNTTLCESSTASFSVGFTGTPTPSIQWEVSSDNGTNWSAIQGATQSFLYVTATAGMNGYQYRSKGVNFCGTATTQAAVLTVQPAPALVTQPKNTLATAGDSVVLTALVTGTNLMYQWQKNMTDIPSATAPTLTLHNVQNSDIATYRLLIGSSCGPSLISDNAVVFVQPSNTNNTTIVVKALMQGCWNGLVHVPTSLSVELRSGDTLLTSTLVTIGSGILSTTGTVSIQFSDLTSGEYWIVVRHGGYLPVASNGKVHIDAGSTVSYDFSNSPSKAYEEGTIPVVLRGTTYYVLKAGDFTGDRSVNPQDIQAMLQGFPKTNSLTIPGM